MKSNRIFMTVMLILAISVSVFSQNNGRERIKAFSMEVEKTMQKRQNKAKEQKAIRLQEREQQKATRLRERETQRKEAEAKRSEMQEKMQPKYRQMHKTERNVMSTSNSSNTVRRKITDNFQQKDADKLALDSIVQSENTKETYRYDHNGNVIECIYYNWGINDWKPDYKYEYAYEGDITTEIEYYWDGSDWEPDYKYEYAYDANGDLSMYAEYYWWKSDYKWVGDWKASVEYNNDTIIVTMYVWDDFNLKWENDEKYKIADDVYGNTVYDVYYVWNDIGNKWEGVYKEVYAYDSNDNLLLEEYYEWSNIAGTWKGVYKEICVYDSDDNILLEEYYEWMNNTWIEDEKYTYTYSHGIILNFYYYVWNIVSKDWEKMGKIIGTTHPDGGISLRMAYEWNGSSWDTVFKWETIAYDTLGNMLETEVIYYEYNLVWEEQEKAIYAWDTNDKWTEMIIYYYNNGTWEANWKAEQNYDIYGNLSMEAYYEWDGVTWVGDHKLEYAYDANGTQTMDAHYYWLADSWVGNYKKEYVYDANDNQLLEQYQNDWDSTWKYGYMYIYAYDANGNRIMEEYSVWDSISRTWEKVFKREMIFKNTYIYNADDFPLYEKYYEWDVAAWELQNSIEWIYNTIGDKIEVIYSELFGDSLKVKLRIVATHDTTRLRTSLVFDEQPWHIMFSQCLRMDCYEYDSVQAIIVHDSTLYYWSSGWLLPTYTISGKVTLDGDPLKGVKITYGTNQRVTTDSEGEYTVSYVDSGSTLVLVPSKEGYTFTPTSITCSNVSSNLYDKDFQANGVGIADADNTNTELVVYPNPTKGVVYISSECDIKLYDIQGKKLQEIRGNQIDISSYPQGMYFLKVEGKILKIVKE